ncbi:unnamed protein product [Lactuca virosa]|uniref:Uncharacterized protein n=1 Tax=Lactuca virosa TaxID=75947 RepID=A0AAU9NY72_9ASTR|nr:unnamed protein product [Lactuca virosa]
MESTHESNDDRSLKSGPSCLSLAIERRKPVIDHRLHPLFRFACSVRLLSSDCRRPDFRSTAPPLVRELEHRHAEIERRKLSNL